MRVTFYKSAGVLIESDGSRLLCDPWLEDGAYYGAWAHVPPCDVTAEEIGRLDGIYITHVHPDHLHESSLAKFDKSIPVYIHRYAFRYLAEAIERLGFTVVEVCNGDTKEVGTLGLTIYAADNCNPHVCGQFFGCDAKVGAERPGSVQIDSLAVISDGTHTIVNVNDCPIELVGEAAANIRERFGKPDLLLVNYVGAGPYPQCMVLPEDEKRAAAERKREQFLSQAERYVRMFEPKAFMPFAGTYTLCGSLAHLNQYRGVPTMAEAARELGQRITSSRCVYLDTRDWYDLGEPLGAWRNVPAPFDRVAYERDVLAHRKLDFEDEPYPASYRLRSLLHEAGLRYAKRCQEVGYESETRVYVQIDDYSAYRLPSAHASGRVVNFREARSQEPYVILSTDPRMLIWLLTGRAHWQDASIGSLITFERRPDKLERGLEFCLNDLHV